MRRSGFFICGKFFLLGLFFVISCLPVNSVFAQETCDNTYYVVSLSDTFNFSQDVVVVADEAEHISTVIGCINVKEDGFYKIRSIVSYSDGQDNESFFLQICDKQTLRCTNACNPNIGPFNIVVDETDVADTTVRNGGTFYLTEGDNIVTLTHYARIVDEYPQFINGADSISGAQSVHMKAFVVEFVDSAFDVEIQESPSVTAVKPGDEYQYRLAVKNVEKSAVYFVNLKNALPPYVTPVSYSVPPVFFDADTLFWTFDSLASGDSIIVDVGVRVDDSPPIRPFNLVNRAWVSGSCDRNSLNGLDSSVVVILPPKFYDLDIKKTTTTDSLFKGQGVTFEIKLKNAGPDTAVNVSIVDLLPQEISFLGTDLEPQRITPDSIYWQIDSLAAGDSIKFKVFTRVNAAGFAVPAEISNKAVVVSDKDINSANDEATATVKVVPRRADLSVIKTADQGSIFKERGFRYSITLQNTGPDTATNILLRDFMPANLIVLSFEPEPTSIAGDTILWVIDTLAVDEAREFTIITKADTSKIRAPIRLLNRVVAEAETDPDTTNNHATAIVDIVPRRYDLSVTKTTSRDSIFKEQNYSYLITVENAGPDTASNISVKDIKPDNIIALSYDPAPVKIVGDSIFWRINSLAVGERRIFTVGAKADTSKITVPAELTNVAIIESENDTEPGNNKDTAIVKIVPRRYDIQITKSVSADSVFPGQGFGYTLSVFNAGPDTASSIQVKDVVPDLASLLYFDPQPQSVTADSVFWGIVLLAPNETVAFNIRARADSSKVGLPRSIINTGVVSSKREINISNNLSTVTNYIVRKRSDLMITKTTNVDSVDEGGTFSYSLLVENIGRDVAERIVLWDLPFSLTPTSDFSITPDYSQQDTLFWLFDSLSAGDFFQIVYAAQAPDSVPTTPFEIPSFARIFAENDVNSQNDFSQSIIIVRPQDDCIVFDRNVFIPQRGELLKIEFELSAGRFVTIDVYDVSGYRVGNLRKEFFAPGLHTIEWDAKNKNGRYVGSGTYLITFKSGRLICYRKIIVVH